MGGEDDTRRTTPPPEAAYAYTELDDALAIIAYASFVARLDKSQLKTPDSSLPPGPWQDLHPEIKQCWREAAKAIRRKLVEAA